MKPCTLSKQTCKTKASVIAFYKADIFERQLRCDLMKKQHFPRAFVIIFQAPRNASTGQGKRALVFLLNDLNMQNILHRDQGDAGE